ncbi:MAG: hypothetical protein NT062_13475 [Proteobacteria bacterium]|nr:hypothetical protein [Pseudomonadota bacterium]
MRPALVLPIVMTVACAQPGFDPTEARDVFTVSNDLVHSLHFEALALPAWPATYTLACPDGGQIAMTSELASDGTPTQLRHAFTACQASGWTIDGELDYLDLTLCDASVASFTIVGRLALADHDDCAIDATETCGVTTGHACGVTL